MKQRKWKILNPSKSSSSQFSIEKLIRLLLKNREISRNNDVQQFLYPPDPYTLTASDVGIDGQVLTIALKRIQKAIFSKESIVVYADYDADGVTAGAILWETLHILGANVKPYIPHRVQEGYGFSKKGIDQVKSEHNPTLIISVDHGVTAWEKIAYAQSLGIEVIVTDHHSLPSNLPKCTLVHTTQLAGAGVSWFVAKELLSMQSAVSSSQLKQDEWKKELVALAAIGTIGDMVPLVHANRALVKYGLEALRATTRLGLIALMENAGIIKEKITTYEVSFMIVPRLNAMGRIVHALDALRLLCTKNSLRAKGLAEQLGNTNRERQQLTLDTTIHARDAIEFKLKNQAPKKILYIADEKYNQGVIGLVAGKLVEKYYLPAIVIAQGKEYSKASARSISGFNIIEAIRSCSELLIDCGGHPMAAGFTVLTDKIFLLQQKLEVYAENLLTNDLLTRVLKIDSELDMQNITEETWRALRVLEPFGIGNLDPVFITKNIKILDMRLIGDEGKHIKLKLSDHKSNSAVVEAIGFGMGEYYSDLKVTQSIDIAYVIDQNTWNGNTKLQLKLKDIHIS